MSPRHAAALRALSSRFDPEGLAAKQALLQRLARAPLAAGAGLCTYHEVLLFLRAHPSDAAQLALVERELRRLAGFMRELPARRREALLNEGLPWADTLARFSHDCVRGLLRHPGCTVTLDHTGEPRLTLNEVLRLTLPAPEWGETTAGLDDAGLLQALKVKARDRLAFTVEELSNLDGRPYLKDHLFDALDLFVRLRPRRLGFSKAYNRLPMPAVFFQRDLQKRFDPHALMNSPLPPPRGLDAAARTAVLGVIHDTLTLTARETDPGTYRDLNSLRLWDLERGLSVALYGMTPDRQLPYESYVGFMAFKNGLAVSYGGAWVLGERADFGMNIFEPYRGGESGLLMCQLLRVYRQAFGVRWFEVDAHQFGLDNPDGIASGAYWFYHRHGFRSVDPDLARLAERERARLAATPGARTPEKLLLAFTGSNVALNFGGREPVALHRLTGRITAMVARRFKGSRVDAVRECTASFMQRTGPARRLDAPARRALEEMALLAAALGLHDAAHLAQLRRMARAKTHDVFGYQQQLLRLLRRAA